MDLIYMNAEKEDVNILADYTFDLAYGADENDFECKISGSRHCCEKSWYLYYEDTEYGGVIDDIGEDTAADEIVYYGRTWHGILNSKIFEPDAGEDYLILSGEGNEVLGSLIDRMNLNSLFVASGEDSGIQISNYHMNRYIAGYDGIRKMLKAYKAKLKLVFKNGFVELSAKPVTDYSKEEQFDTDQIEFQIKKKGNPLNHVICLGKGDLAEREVIHVYADEQGNIVDSQIYKGLDEVADVYDNANAESADELRQGGADRIAEAWNADDVQFTFSSDEETYDVGDIVGAKAKVTGIEVNAEITKKIVTISNNTTKISYKVGERL